MQPKNEMPFIKENRPKEPEIRKAKETDYPYKMIGKARVINYLPYIYAKDGELYISWLGYYIRITL